MTKMTVFREVSEEGTRFPIELLGSRGGRMKCWACRWVLLGLCLAEPFNASGRTPVAKHRDAKHTEAIEKLGWDWHLNSSVRFDQNSL